MECEGETWSPPGPKPKGLGGWRKSKLGKDLGAHEIGVSEVSRVKYSKSSRSGSKVNSNISPEVP